MITPTTILHLSDLHFASQGGHYWNSPDECQELKIGIPSHDQRGLIGSIALDLDRLEAKPDLIIVSGDIIDKANNEGVDLAQAFFRSLLERLELPVERLILVPGNHDVLRQTENQKKYALFAKIWNAVFGNARPLFDEERPPHQMVDVYRYDNFGLEIVGFNSCESLDEGQEHGSIGQGQRDYIERLLSTTTRQRLFRIAVMHHHLEKSAGAEGRRRSDYSEIFDASLVRDWMLAMSFRLVLHGHQHVAWERNVSTQSQALTIAASGSTGISSYGRRHWDLPLGYQVIRIDQEAANPCKIYRREYVTAKLEWAPERPPQSAMQSILSESKITSGSPAVMDNTLMADEKLAEYVLFDRYTLNSEPYYIQRDIDQDLLRITRSKGVWIHGGAGLGKTSCLLRHIEQTQHHTCYISLGNIVDGKVVSVLEQIYLDICTKYEITLKKTKGISANHLIRLIVSAIAIVPQSDLVIYLDEMPIENQKHAIDLAKSIVALILQVASHVHDRRVRFLISSIPTPVGSIARHQAQIYEYIHFTECPSWSPENLRQLLELACSSLSISASPTDKEKIISSAAGSPRFIKNCIWKILLLRDRITLEKIIADVSAELRSR